MKVKLSEITNEMLVSSIPMGKVRNAIDTIISGSVDKGALDYCVLECLKEIYLLIATLKDEYELQFDTTDVYENYDSLMSLGLNQNNKLFYSILDKEVSKFEASLSRPVINTPVEQKIVFEDEITRLIDSATLLLTKLSDKKHVNGIVKSAVTSMPKDLVENIKNLVNDLKSKKDNVVELKK